MTNKSDTREVLEETLEKLSSSRMDLVRIEVQLNRLSQKKRLLDLDARRKESTAIIEINDQRDTKGNPYIQDKEVRRAMVEDVLSRDKTFLKILHRSELCVKDFNRKSFKADTLRAKIKGLESQEKLLLLT